MSKALDPTILRDQSQIADASTAVLLATYNALTGESVARFSSRAAAERRVTMAMLAATDRTAHAGVKPGEKIVPKSAAELGIPEDRREPSEGDVQPDTQPGGEEPADGHPDPAVTPIQELPPVADGNPHPESAPLSRSIWSQLESAKPVVARQKVEGAKAPATRITHVRATFAGTSSLQQGSIRNSVLLFIQAAEVDAEGKPGAVSIEQIDSHISTSSRGYVQKLIEKGHVESVPAPAPVEGEKEAA